MYAIVILKWAYNVLAGVALQIKHLPVDWKVTSLIAS